MRIPTQHRPTQCTSPWQLPLALFSPGSGESAAWEQAVDCMEQQVTDVLMKQVRTLMLQQATARGIICMESSSACIYHTLVSSVNTWLTT